MVTVVKYLYCSILPCWLCSFCCRLNVNYYFDSVLFVVGWIWTCKGLTSLTIFQINLNIFVYTWCPCIWVMCAYVHAWIAGIDWGFDDRNWLIMVKWCQMASLYRSWSTSVQVMACHLFGGKPLPEPMLIKWFIIRWNITNKLHWNVNQNRKLLRKRIWS